MEGSLLVSCICADEADRAEEFVAAGDFLTFKFPVWQWYVFTWPGAVGRSLVTIADSTQGEG